MHHCLMHWLFCKSMRVTSYFYSHCFLFNCCFKFSVATEHGHVFYKSIMVFITNYNFTHCSSKNHSAVTAASRYTIIIKIERVHKKGVLHILAQLIDNIWGTPTNTSSSRIPTNNMNSKYPIVFDVCIPVQTRNVIPLQENLSPRNACNPDILRCS